MKNKRILLVGGGGHCKSVLDSLIDYHEFSEIAIIDKAEKRGTEILGIPVIGSDEELEFLFNEGFKYAFVTIGSVGKPFKRIEIFSQLQKIGFEMPNIIDSSAIVSKHTTLGRCVYVGKNTVINSGATVGKGVIVNTSVTIEHECNIGDFVHIATGAVLCGEVNIGSNSHIGANSTIKQRIKIGENSIIGMGAVVLKNIPDHSVAVGNPAKIDKIIKW